MRNQTKFPETVTKSLMAQFSFAMSFQNTKQIQYLNSALTLIRISKIFADVINVIQTALKCK